MMHIFSNKAAFIAVTAISLLTAYVKAQTSPDCNPLTQGGCLADPALGRSVNIDFTSGASDSFTTIGSATHNSNGAAFTVTNTGDSPHIVSKWYIMFGHVEFVIKAAPGTGIVSSAVLISDCLDEIDWEWIGGDNTAAQSNYFGKGMTTTYNRGASHQVAGNHDDFHKYTIDWTAERIVWQIDGVTVRSMTVANAAQGQYPQTPMQIKVGAWSGGDPSTNQAGTIAWAGGATDYSAGPFTMYLKSMAVTDYSTGTSYSYSGTDGTWQSIKSDGGSIGKNSDSGALTQTGSAPQVAASSNSAPIPLGGTNKDSTSTFVTPTVWPWVGTATATLQTAVSTGVTSISGLPSGWTVTSSGKVLPPSAGSLMPPSTSPLPLSPSDSPLPSVAEVVTTYDQRGFLTTATLYAVTSFDSQGSPVTSHATVPVSAAAAKAASTSQSTLPLPSGTLPANEAQPEHVFKAYGAAAGLGLLGIALIV